MTTIIPILAFRDNYIWAVRSGDTAAVVDPGDAAPVFAWLDANDAELSAILATHHHADHVGGVAALCARNARAGRPICSAWKPKMSATVRSKYARSRSCRYMPGGVVSHAANVSCK